MSRRYVIPKVPRDQLPDLSSTLWKRWSTQLAAYIERNPVDWEDLAAYAILIGTSLMSVRNLIAYLEDVGYAVSYRHESSVLWCGCKDCSACSFDECPKLELRVMSRRKYDEMEVESKEPNAW